MNNKLSVGVVVGRFQVSALTPGHKGLIAQLQSKHTHLIVLLGTSPVLLSKRNPLPYVVREQMIREEFPHVTILPIMDMKHHEKWTAALDKKNHEVAPYADITLYGGRDSF